MNKIQEQVQEFQETFGQPVGKFPQGLSMKRKLARASWMTEELSEYLKASAVVDEIDALADLVYFAFGTAVEMGLDLGKFIDVVQEANMSKLWDDGEPHFNEQGKIVKPPTWVDPKEKLLVELRRQFAGAM